MKARSEPAVAGTERVRAAFERVARTALDEDLGGGGPEGDVTTTATVPKEMWGEAEVVAKAEGVICGLAALEATFGLLGGAAVERRVSDGDVASVGTVVARVRGPLRVLLTGERAALNVLGHLSGIATLTRRFVQAARDVEIVDTRKTLPGMRALEKYAVRCGGGANHRFALWDGVLVKDNHIAAAGGISEAVRRMRAAATMPVQVECADAAQVSEAVEAGADALLLDNFDPVPLTAVVAKAREGNPRVLVEASGGVTEKTVAEFAATGVDRISVGALTHSAPALDLSMRVSRTWRSDEGPDESKEA